MAVKTTEELLALLEKSKLLLPEQFATVADSTDAKSAAQQLIKDGQLTKWQAQQLLAGRHTFFLGKYKLLSKLGEGGMGAVYKAEQHPLKRLVALKVMSDKMLKQPGAVKRFHREIQSVAALNHPNIIAAFDADQVGNTHFLVMEYVEGRDLKAFIKEFGRLPVDWSCECIRQAALGLAHAEEEGIVHRDIKPSNLLIIEGEKDEPPLVKILDMGLARFTSEAQCTILTQTGQVLGTIDFISPEQANDTKGVDIRADIFSLGASLFQCVTGEVPFKGKNPMEKLMGRAMKDAPRASTLRDIPKSLDDIIAKMLARNPDNRFSTADEVADALEAFAAGDDLSSSITMPKGVVVESTVEAEVDETLNAFLDELGTDADEESDEAGGYEEEEWEDEPPKPFVAKLVVPVVAMVVVVLLGVVGLVAWNSSTTYDTKVAASKEKPKDSFADPVIEWNGTTAPDDPQAHAKLLAARFEKEYNEVRKHLQHSPDPTVRSFLIHRLAPSGVDPKLVIERITSEQQPDIKQALVLCLGEYTEKQLPVEKHEELANVLAPMFRYSPDAGIHGATEWLLRKWGYKDLVDAIIGQLSTGKIEGENQWYVNKQGMTFTVLEMDDGHRIAIGTKEVTVREFLKFRPEFDYDKSRSTESNGPVNTVTWYQTVEYCNWLSAQEGIGHEQWCYRPTTDGNFDDGMGLLQYAKKTAYRLPDEKEWEFACRAGTTTEYSFGGESVLPEKYAWHKDNSRKLPRGHKHSWAVGTLKPNGFGLFDVHGNVWEWCQDRSRQPVIGKDTAEAMVPRVVRGGSFITQLTDVRSANRRPVQPDLCENVIGFRLCRTLLSPEQIQAQHLAKHFTTNYPQVRERLKHSLDPTVRSFLIHQLAPAGVSPQDIWKRMEEEKDVSIRRALLLSLGEFDEKELPKPSRFAMAASLLNVFRDDPDSGIHGATEWLLRKWGRSEQIAEIEEELATGKIEGDRKWYINKQGMTFAVLEMEDGHRFAIGTKEVTVEDYLKFKPDFDCQKRYSPESDCPISASWCQATEYCNWFSAQEGITRDAWCYAPNEEGEYHEGMKSLQYDGRTGYRLPDGKEWEFACRAGTTTEFSFGDSLLLIGEFAWYRDQGKMSLNNNRSVGRLKPNDNGLFDVHGNIWESVQNRYNQQVLDNDVIQASIRRETRGGAFNTKRPSSRLQYHAEPCKQVGDVGFRLARTLPPSN